MKNVKVQNKKSRSYVKPRVRILFADETDIITASTDSGLIATMNFDSTWF